MKITLHTGILRQALKAIATTIKTNPIVPILENALIEITPDRVTVTGSDLQTTIIRQFVQDSRVTGSMALPHRTLTALLDQINTPQVVFEYNQDTQKATIIAGTKRIGLAGENPDDYPRTPQIDAQHKQSFVMTSADMIDALEKVSFACTSDELRPAMTGVLFDLKQSRMVATDSHRLVLYKLADMEDINQFIVPRSIASVKNIFKSDQPLQIEVDGRKIKITGDDTTVHIRLIDERFPDIDAVIPEKGDYLLVDREDLLKEVTGATVVTNKTTHQIELSIKDGTMEITAEDLYFNNDYRSEVKIDQQGKDLIIGMNANMLREELSKCDEEMIKIFYSQENRAILITTEDNQYTILQMPVMIHQGI